ncbi:MAG: bifunctional enzyme conserved domain protein, partial [Marmoricola sp.]|nr:bifunctional enzyme conserved domain protein [Marmoricola sp.]
MAHSEIVEIRGHLIDTAALSKVLNDIAEYGGDYVVEQFDIGHGSADPSYARINVSAVREDTLQRILMRLQIHGVNQVDPGEAQVDVADMDGVFPDGFYSSTNLETQVRLDGHWVRVRNPEMDCGLVVLDGDETAPEVRTLPMSDVHAGMKIVCGASGIKVTVPIPTKEEGSFGFMESDVSSEKPQAVLVRQVADGMREAKLAGRKVLWVGGPGVVHTGASDAMVSLVEAGYVDVLFAGNALATHDIESALYGTSLGIDLARGQGVE